MAILRNMLDRIEPLFDKGGKLEKYAALYEMVDTVFYSPSTVTRVTPHVRDAVDLKRVMILVLVASLIHARQDHPECRTLSDLAYQFDSSPVFRYDFIRHRQPEPRALARLFGCKKGLEYLGH